MLVGIGLAVVGIWFFVFVLLLGLCRDAKAGDRAMEIAAVAFRPSPPAAH
jgi:hypothetical protein